MFTMTRLQLMEGKAHVVEKTINTDVRGWTGMMTNRAHVLMARYDTPADIHE